MKKKIYALMMVLAMTVSMYACGDSGNNGGSGGNSEVSEEKTEVTLGTTSWPTNMFFYLAKEKGIAVIDESGVRIQEPSQAGEKSFRQPEQVFPTLIRLEKLMIENERNPSWVPLVTLFLPVELAFLVF